VLKDGKWVAWKVETLASKIDQHLADKWVVMMAVYTYVYTYRYIYTYVCLYRYNNLINL
jgi:hypothetical protein